MSEYWFCLPAVLTLLYLAIGWVTTWYFTRPGTYVLNEKDTLFVVESVDLNRGEISIVVNSAKDSRATLDLERFFKNFKRVPKETLGMLLLKNLNK